MDFTQPEMKYIEIYQVKASLYPYDNTAGTVQYQKLCDNVAGIVHFQMLGDKLLLAIYCAGTNH